MRYFTNQKPSFREIFSSVKMIEKGQESKQDVIQACGKNIAADIINWQPKGR